MKTKKKLRIKNFIIFLLVLLLLGFIIGFFLLRPVKNILIMSNNVLTDEEIIKVTELDNYPPFIMVNKLRFKKHPLIRNIKIKRKFYNKIILDVNEVKVLFYDNLNKKYVLDNSKELDINKALIRPLIINHIPDNNKKRLVNSFKEYDEGLLNTISEIKYAPTEFDKDRFLFTMSDGNYVYINNANMDNIVYYEKIVKVLQGKKGLLYLDNGANEGSQFKILE